MAMAPRAVLVYRRSELDELLAAHGTRPAAEFFLRSRGRSLDNLVARQQWLTQTLAGLAATLPGDWRQARLERADLPRFAFAPEDVIVTVGPDGLVANVAKYLSGQPVVAVSPNPRDAALARFGPDAAGRLLRAGRVGSWSAQARTQVVAQLDDGQRLQALNEIFVGHPSHQSAIYELCVSQGLGERQSSSGLIVGTGTGASGWLASLAHDRGTVGALPAPRDRHLAWFVREAWPSPGTGVELTAGILAADRHLGVVSESEGLVVFGDGMEDDRLRLAWGQGVHIGVSEQCLTLVNP